jgi:uncharacterized membrane protein YdjX (TVP38/TMEM64 family)
MKKIILRIALLIMLFIALWALFRFTPAGELADFSKIAGSRDNLIKMVQSRYALSVLLFILIYIGAVALSVPGATVLSLSGGFFFGPWLAALYINIGATIGAFLIFLLARTVLGNSIQSKYSEKLEQFNRELEKNGPNYMLTLRLIPLFPFFLVNLLAGVTNLKAGTFIWTTSLGIIPGSFVFAYLGYAGASLEPGGTGFPKEPLIALILLGLLSLLPVIIKKWKEKSHA